MRFLSAFLIFSLLVGMFGGCITAAPVIEEQVSLDRDGWNTPTLADTTLRAGRSAVKKTANVWSPYLTVEESPKGLEFRFTKAVGTVFEGLSRKLDLNGLSLKFSSYENAEPNSDGKFAVSFGDGEYDRFDFGLIFDTKNGRIYPGQSAGESLVRKGSPLLEIVTKTEIDGILYDCEPEYAGEAVCAGFRKAIQNSGRNLVYIGGSANDRGGAYDLEQYGVMNYKGYDKTSTAIGEHQKDDKEFFIDEGFNIVDAVKWSNLASETNGSFYEEVKQMLRIRRQYGYVFDQVSPNHRDTHICMVDTSGPLDLQAYGRYADTYGNNKTGNLLALCKALFAYSDSAKAYFQ